MSLAVRHLDLYAEELFQLLGKHCGICCGKVSLGKVIST
jgi:hypothetical protein